MSTTIAQWLTIAARSGVDRLDAHLLLAEVMQQSRTWLMANDAVTPTEAQQRRLVELVARRAEGEPLAYLTGEKEFHGLSLSVTPAVLVPRPDTETIVDWALNLLPQWSAPRLLDLGTGSGAIALAIKARHGQAKVTALDISLDALAVARLNAERLKLEVRFLHGDWWSAVAGERFELIVSNPPYIAVGDSHLPALRYEPELALTSGVDGLDSIRHLIARAPQHLSTGGWFLLEHGHDQATAVTELLTERGFELVTSRQDLAGHARCTGGRWVVQP